MLPSSGSESVKVVVGAVTVPMTWPFRTTR